MWLEWEGEKRTRRKIASEFRLIASSKCGAGIGLGPAILVVVILGDSPDAWVRCNGMEEEGEDKVEVESESLSLLLFGRRTTLRPETGEYVLLESGVGKNARSKRK